jgi:septal ring factor EnvC (AmiA/AmiB activator)
MEAPMADIAVETYKKNVAITLERWEKKSKPVAEQIEKISVELKKLQTTDVPTPEQQAKVDKLVASRDKLKKQLETYGDELRLNLMVLTPPQKGKADEKELIQLPRAIADLVKKRGISFGNITLKPDVDIDLKGFKLKKAGITLELKF